MALHQWPPHCGVLVQSEWKYLASTQDHTNLIPLPAKILVSGPYPGWQLGPRDAQLALPKKPIAEDHKQGMRLLCFPS